MDAAKIFLFLAVYLQGSLCSERKKSFSSCKDGKGSLYDYAIKDIYDMQVPQSFYKNHIDLTRCPAPDNFIDDIDKITWSPVRNDDITWNFEKILVDHKGQPYRRYTPTVEPKEMIQDIEKLIQECEEETMF
ncbi:hypothetical protein OS493_004617 [Desmophyllum pertusum]|uniref:Glutathione peroxidase n=1 Tax=Desmophyllum pertusum TaxID=174260 RepID=A0A9W9ZG32_9CNID|nr:hypothetical protein OS493_004617 [Desmophyllum pertusum]